MRVKNVVLKSVVILFIFIVGMCLVDAATNPYSEYSSFGKNCTWYAWDQVYKRLGIALPGWHNANRWYNDAQKSGYEVGQTPRPNSIVVWQWNEYGHVAFVEKVVGDKIYIWDSSTCYDYVNTNQEEYDQCILNGVSEETDKACRDKYIKVVPTACEYPATYWQTPGDLIGYVYLDKVPTKSYSTSGSTEASFSGTTTKRSSNANLSSITISNVDFEFHTTTYQYELVVDSEVDHLKIDASTEDSKAQVEGLGEYELKIGTNTITLNVSAEDGTKNTYTIFVKRKDNNASLSSLIIHEIDFSFNPNILEYTLEIGREVEKVIVDATADSEFAQVEGLGEYLLNSEETTMEVMVRAEDHTEKNYKIVIKKEPEPEKEAYHSFPLWLFGIFLSVILLLSSVIFFKKRKKAKLESLNKKIKFNNQ